MNGYVEKRMGGAGVYVFTRGRSVKKGLIFDISTNWQIDKSRLHSAMTRQKRCEDRGGEEIGKI